MYGHKVTDAVTINIAFSLISLKKNEIKLILENRQALVPLEFKGSQQYFLAHSKLMHIMCTTHNVTFRSINGQECSLWKLHFDPSHGNTVNNNRHYVNNGSTPPYVCFNIMCIQPKAGGCLQIRENIVECIFDFL